MLHARLTTVMYHRKHRGPDNPDMAFAFDFPADHSIRVLSTEVPDWMPDDEASEERTFRDLVLDALVPGNDTTYKALSDLLQQPVHKVTVTCFQLKEMGKVTLPKAGWVRLA
jgi:hypothetical protein